MRPSDVVVDSLFLGAIFLQIAKQQFQNIAKQFQNIEFLLQQFQHIPVFKSPLGAIALFLSPLAAELPMPDAAIGCTC